MKILYISQLFYPALYGGGEYIFYHWARELVRRGHDILVITQRLQGTADEEMVKGMRIFRVGSAIELKRTFPTGIRADLLFLLGALRKGTFLLRNNQIDIIHSNTYIPVIAGQFLASWFKKPHIVSYHGVYMTSQEDFWKKWSEQKGVSRTSKFLGPLLEKFIAKLPATRYHTVSESSRNDLLSLGIKKEVVVIPNGIDQEDYECSEVRKEPHTCIYVGRLVFQKNIETIVRASKSVVEVIPDAKLIIVGDGPMRENLEKLTASLSLGNNVLFMGRVSHEQKVRLIRQSSFLVLPSLVEPFGIAILEAFACSKPVIVSNVSPLSDLVEESMAGFTVSPIDVEQWSRKMLWFFQNPNKTDLMGEMGLQKVLSKYSIRRVVDELEVMYETVRRH
jgi:glycosyltransferase involved in cell wall biosynthesis